MKLWIDDVRPMPKNYDVWAKNAEEAVKLLLTGEVTHVSFDHDLGMELSNDKDIIVTAKENKYAKTGYDVAMWIEREAYLGKIKPFTYKIHSSNPVGAKNIESAMKNAERYWKCQLKK